MDSNLEANTLLHPGEKIIFKFQSSPKLHISWILYYIFSILIAGAIFQFILFWTFNIEWQPAYILVPLAAVLFPSELLRRATKYLITTERLIKEVSMGPFRSSADYFYRDFSSVHLFSKSGFIFGYDNLRLNRSGIIENFFPGQVRIDGLDNLTAEKVKLILNGRLSSNK